MDLRDTLGTIVEELRSACRSRTIELSCPPLPGTWDRDRLERVFSNLVNNAIVHGYATKPVTIVGCAENSVIQVEVHNEGQPIPKPLRPALFNPFAGESGTAERRRPPVWG